MRQTSKFQICLQRKRNIDKYVDRLNYLKIIR